MAVVQTVLNFHFSNLFNQDHRKEIPLAIRFFARIDFKTIPPRGFKDIDSVLKGGTFGNHSGKGCIPLKIENLGFGSQIDEVRCAVEHHVREKSRLVNLTGGCTGDSAADGHLLFDQIRQIIPGGISGPGPYRQIPFRVGPQHTPTLQKSEGFRAKAQRVKL